MASVKLNLPPRCPDCGNLAVWWRGQYVHRCPDGAAPCNGAPDLRPSPGAFVTRVLTIGSARIEVADLAEAQRVYCARRDASGEGASTFPTGRFGALRISYNGRAWDADGVEVGSGSSQNVKG